MPVTRSQFLTPWVMVKNIWSHPSSFNLVQWGRRWWELSITSKSKAGVTSALEIPCCIKDFMLCAVFHSVVTLPQVM
eukprot:NODE_865_length_573_cov_258.811659_g855_i0.p1 GENE.NODE_865_length_573_cov_258.811659_g855_i0~~NODE_865_length_573_cov_258.811659_g855_i0.p1  ORF type:complete len:77 (-),score=9.71 NODE_865_length_573_cov_258.811659_g855_i0:200-430(-)